MGWITQDAAVRARSEIGIYGVTQWAECAEDLGLRIEYAAIPFGIESFILGRLIVLNEGMTPFQEAAAVWHEIAHWMFHRSNVNWWASRPQGDITVAKFERQACEFASMFPDWE